MDDIEQIIKKQFFQIMENRKYDVNKFKIINTYNNKVFKLLYEDKFITYIETKDYDIKNLNKSQTKIWYSYRTKLINYVNSIINDSSIFDIICLINVLDNLVLLDHCIDSLLKQHKKVYIILIISNNNTEHLKIAFKHNIEYCITSEKEIINRFNNGIMFVRGKFLQFKTLMICNSNDVFLKHWTKESFELIHKDYDIIGTDNNYIIDLSNNSIFKRTIDIEYLYKINYSKPEDVCYYNGLLIKRSYLIKIGWKLFDTTPNISLNIFNKMLNYPEVGKLGRTTYICLLNNDTKNIYNQYVFNELNTITTLNEIPKFELEILETYNIKLSELTTVISYSGDFIIDKQDVKSIKYPSPLDPTILNAKYESKELIVPNIILKPKDEIIQLRKIIPAEPSSPDSPKSPPKIIIDREEINRSKLLEKEYELRKLQESLDIIKSKYKTEKEPISNKYYTDIKDIEIEENENELMLNNCIKDIKKINKIRKSFIKISPRQILTIIPVLGRHNILKLCIEALLLQTIKTDILLLVSNHDDVNFAKSLNIKYVFVENNPLSFKFQKGVEYAKYLDAKYIMFVGSDDLLTKRWIEECIITMEDKELDVVGKNLHYIYDSIRDTRYIRKYVADNLINIPKNIRKQWCLGSGRLIKNTILEIIDWKLFKKELDRGLDAESGLILHRGGAKFGIINKENFLSIRDDWECITKMDTIVNSESNQLNKIKIFNTEIESLKNNYIKIRDPKLSIKKSTTSQSIVDNKDKSILIIKSNSKMYNTLISKLEKYKLIIDDLNTIIDLNKINLAIILDSGYSENNFIKKLGQFGIVCINNYNLPNCINWTEYDIFDKIKLFNNYNKHKLYHKVVEFESFNETDFIYKFAKNIKFKNKLKQIYISPSLDFFKSKIFKYYDFLSPYYTNTEPAIFFGIYDRYIDKSIILNHNNIGIICWGGSDIYNKTIYDKEFLEILKTKTNIFHVALSKDISDILSINNIKHIRHIFSFIEKSLFKPIKLGNCIYVYSGKSDSTYNNPILQYIKNKYTKYEYIDSQHLNTEYELMPSIYSKCFIGIRLTSFDGNANTVQELGLMGINCIHNGDYPNSINWTLNNIDNIIDIIEEESKKIGSVNHNLADKCYQYINNYDLNNYIIYSDFIDLYNNLDISPTVSVIINTYNNDSNRLRQIINDHLEQEGLEDIQIIISTVENDKSIELFNNEFKDNNKIELCICSKEEHPGKGPLGIYYQLNKASKLIKNNWVAYFSGNDNVYKNKYKLEINECKKNGKLVCYSSFFKIKNNIKKKIILPKEYSYENHLQTNYVSDCSLINKYIYNKLVPFKLEYENHGFWDLFLRIYENFGNIFCYNDKETWEYIIDDNSSHILRKNNPNLLQINNYYKDLLLKNRIV